MCTRAEFCIDVFSCIIITSFESRLPKNQLSFHSSEYITEPSHYSLIGNFYHFFIELDEERVGVSQFLSLIHSPRAHSPPLVTMFFNFKKVLPAADKLPVGHQIYFPVLFTKNRR